VCLVYTSSVRYEAIFQKLTQPKHVLKEILLVNVLSFVFKTHSVLMYMYGYHPEDKTSCVRTEVINMKVNHKL
jgi:hypothetical protein